MSTSEEMQKLRDFCQIPHASAESTASQRAIIFNLSGHRIHQGIFDYLISKGYKSFALFGTEDLYLKRGKEAPSYEEQTFDFVEKFLATKNKDGLLPSTTTGVLFVLLPAYNAAVIRLVLAITSLFRAPIVLDVGKIGHSDEFTVIGGVNTGNWTRWWRERRGFLLRRAEETKDSAKERVAS